MKYPVQYFCGQGLLMYTSEFIHKGLNLFPTDVPLVGETGIDGVLLDFNCGLRLQIPEGNWHVRIADADSGLLFVDRDVSCQTLVSLEKFYIEWEVALWLDGEPVFYHRLDPTDQIVHFRFETAVLGDNIVLLPYVEEFRRTFGCRVTCTISKTFHGIIKNYFPNVSVAENIPEDAYACYYLGGWMSSPISSTSDVRAMPMEDFGRAILHTPRIRKPSKVLYRPTKPREISEPYVCIGVQASGTPKSWLAPGGWDQVVDHLKSLGYRVLCIDRDRHCSNYGMTVEMPEGAEDFSGNYTLIDRVNQLAYADFFIGASSGLSWLAWVADVPTVLISGITDYWYEPASTYRVYNPLVCHGCFNDRRINGKMILECVRWTAPERRYECSTKISAQQVIAAIDRLIADHNLDGRN